MRWRHVLCRNRAAVIYIVLNSFVIGWNAFYSRDVNLMSCRSFLDKRCGGKFPLSNEFGGTKSIRLEPPKVICIPHPSNPSTHSLLVRMHTPFPHHPRQYQKRRHITTSRLYSGSLYHDRKAHASESTSPWLISIRGNTTYKSSAPIV